MVNDSANARASGAGGLLRLLEERHGDFVSGELLSRRLAVSRTSVWKHVRALREQGYGIESRPNRGHRLVSCPDRFSLLEVKRLLRSRVFGNNIDYVASAPSTQDRAFDLARKGAAEGTVVVAEEQTGGRGRVGRSFFSPPGGLWFSVILRPPVRPQLCMPLSLMAGVAVSEAIRESTGLPAVLKWPNDILLNGRKVAGILAEIVAETDAVRFVVCGIGINANISAEAFPPDLKNIATSLSAELGRDTDRSRLLCRTLENMDRHYAAFLSSGVQSILDSWRACPNVLGVPVRVKMPEGAVEGTASSLDEEGALLIRTADGSLRRVIVGDVSLQDAGD